MYKLSHGHYDEAATRSFLNFRANKSADPNFSSHRFTMCKEKNRKKRMLQKTSPKILVQVSRHGPMEQPSRCLSRSIKFERLQEPFRQIVGAQQNYV